MADDERNKAKQIVGLSLLFIQVLKSVIIRYASLLSPYTFKNGKGGFTIGIFFIIDCKRFNNFFYLYYTIKL